MPNPDIHHARHVKPRLWIRTLAGSTIGFGHLRRCLTLAKLLEGTVRPVFLLDSDDIGSQMQVTAQGLHYECLRLDRIWSKIPSPAAVLVDTRETERTLRLVEEARERRIRIVSIHDLGLSPLPSDIVVDGSILPSTGGFPRSDTSFYTGTSYLVMDPLYSLLHQRKKRINEKIRSVAVILGGGDSGGCFVKVLEGLRLWGKELEVVGFPGFAYWGQKSLTEIDWHPLRFRWAGQSESVAKLTFRSDLAVTAGGISAFEALCTGTPVVALAVDGHQEITVSTLAHTGACLDLGRMDTFRPVQMRDAIAFLSDDRARRERISKRARRIVDGRGAERVCSIIREVLSAQAESAAIGVAND